MSVAEQQAQAWPFYQAALVAWAEQAVGLQRLGWAMNQIQSQRQFQPAALAALALQRIDGVMDQRQSRRQAHQFQPAALAALALQAVVLQRIDWAMDQSPSQQQVESVLC